MQRTDYVFNGNGNLTQETRPGGEPALTHVYNGMDERVATTRGVLGTGSDTRRFLYTPDGRVLGGAEGVAEPQYGANASDVKAEFIWMSPEVGESGTFGGDDGLGGYMPLAVSVPTATTGITELNWVHSNHLGVPIWITDASGMTIAQSSSYTAPAFPGQSRTLVDLYYNKYRDYDPTTGRYMQADPIGLAGGASPYSYAMNNPLRYTDPTGEFGLAGALVGGGIDLSIQLLMNGGEIGCVDWSSVGVSALAGAVGAPAWARYGERGLASGMSRANAAFPRGIERVERSHFWPARWGGTFSKYNTKLMWGSDHALADSKRYRFMRRWWKDANPLSGPVNRFWNRLPDWTKGATIPSGLASSVQSLTSSENSACQ